MTGWPRRLANGSVSVMVTMSSLLSFYTCRVVLIPLIHLVAASALKVRTQQRTAPIGQLRSRSITADGDISAALLSTLVCLGLNPERTSQQFVVAVGLHHARPGNTNLKYLSSSPCSSHHLCATRFHFNSFSRSRIFELVVSLSGLVSLLAA
ncbi:hypothetical protein IF2G_07824 [Cordyceps javanica]|nr:hypothetical protein IF2G_07824 [Cordyceps javanica]